MKTYQYPEVNDWTALCQRPILSKGDLAELVSQVFEAIRQEGDIAVRRYSENFDKVQLSDFRVSANTLKAAEKSLSPELKKAIELAKNNRVDVGDSCRASRLQGNCVVLTTECRGSYSSSDLVLCGIDRYQASFCSRGNSGHRCHDFWNSNCPKSQ